MAQSSDDGGCCGCLFIIILAFCLYSACDQLKKHEQNETDLKHRIELLEQKK